jgi:hypothetical protein
MMSYYLIPILPPDDCEREYEGLMANIKTTIDKMSDYDQMFWNCILSIN